MVSDQLKLESDSEHTVKGRKKSQEVERREVVGGNPQTFYQPHLTPKERGKFPRKENSGPSHWRRGEALDKGNRRKGGTLFG